MVNINDYEVGSDIPEDKNVIAKIFEKQLQLATEYIIIEKMPEVILSNPETNIDTKEGQIWLKDFAWRVTEELCEALEAKELAHEKIKSEYSHKIFQLHSRNHKINEQEIYNDMLHNTEEFSHYLEEVTDALHFMVELCLIAGYKAEEFNLPPMYQAREMDVVYQLGLACNCLKNKKWKQTQMLTDRPKFKKYMLMAFTRLLGLYFVAGLNLQDIYCLYFKKCEVNKFRQRSKY